MYLQDFAQTENFWRKTLKGFQNPAKIGKKQVARHHADQAETFARHMFIFSVGTTRSLKDMAQQNHLTLNSILQGAWAILLGKYNGAEDVVFGSTISGRPTELNRIEEVVGLFLNVIPVRVRVSPKTPLLSFMKSIHQQQTEAIAMVTLL